MTQPDPKYVSASRPVNRRTAKPEPKAEPVSQVVQERLASKWMHQRNKSRFGLPLTEQLQRAARPARASAMSPLFITGGMVSTVAAVGLLLAAIQHSVLLAGAGTLALGAGGALMWVARRSNALSEQLVTETALFDAASLLAFDRALDSMAADAPDAVVTELTGLKHQLARIAQLAAHAPVDEHFTMDDRLYLTELLRRYLPDSLEAYLMVPKAQRPTELLEQGETAVSLLLGQFRLLCKELDKREKKLTKSKAENLLRQQRFLESKSSR